MKDVARLAGVSVATVSRVMNNTVRVDEATRARVEAAIRKTNFRPNLVARGLRSKSGNLIGLIVPEVAHESFSYFLHFTEASVERRGYNLIIGNTNNDPDLEESFVRSFIRRHVDGVIFSRVSDESRLFRIIEESQVPLVIIDRSLEREDIPTVVMDNYRAGVLVAEHLLGLGHREFACITGPTNISIVRERLAGFRDTVAAGSGRLSRACVVDGGFKFEGGVKAARRLLSCRQAVTAIWAQNDLMAIGAMSELSRSGVSVPGQMSLAGLDNARVSWMVYPELTTVAQPFERMCDSAVDLIFRLKLGERIPERKIVHAPELIVRSTTSAPQTRSAPQTTSSPESWKPEGGR